MVITVTTVTTVATVSYVKTDNNRRPYANTLHNRMVSLPTGRCLELRIRIL